MPKNNDNIDDLNILRKIQHTPKISQRALAQELGFSLGKINYCLSALKIKGLIKLNNFKLNNHKLGYFYILTPKGIITKTNLTLKFMQLKMAEYDELQKEFAKEKKLIKINKNTNK